MRTLILTLVTIIWAVHNSLADEPLSVPSRLVFKSPGGNITVVSDPKRGTTVRNTKKNTFLWKLPRWYRSLFPSNDGIHLVTIYDGLNLIPEFDESLVLFSFWRSGDKVRDVRLKELAPNKGVLHKTVSHYHWGMAEGITESNLLSVKRADGKRFNYDLDSGKLVQTPAGKRRR